MSGGINAMWTVSEREIRQYSAMSDGRDFTDLVNQIIYAQCITAALPQSAISTNLKSVSDDGVDTRVDRAIPGSGWLEYPTIWQFKASSVASIKPYHLRKEINKDYAAQRIREGYAYRFCVCDSLPDKKKTEWRQILTEAARKITADAVEPQVLGTDELSRWSREYPTIALLVRPDLDRVSIPFSVWAQRERENIRQYVPVPSWQDIERRVREHVDFSISPFDVVLPLTGEPGVGKTRLMCEVLAQLEHLTGLVVYTENDEYAEDLARRLSISDAAHAILVADECSLGVQSRLHRSLQSCRDRVRVIAIDNSGDWAPAATAVQKLERMPNEVVRQVLEQNFGYVASDRRELYIDLADGYLRLAADMCRFDPQIVAEGSTTPVLGIVERYLRDRLPPEEFRVIEALSLVFNVGCRDDIAQELDHLCMLTGLVRQDVERTVTRLHNAPGFVARAGRYLYITPEVVAQAAFESAWRTHCSLDFTTFARRMAPELIETFLKRVNKSASREVRDSVHTYFRGVVTAFRPDNLASVRAVHLMLTFCEISPEPCVPILRTVIENATREQLLATDVRGGHYLSPRRQLVWFCERMVAFPEHFDDVEAILQRLALAENETSIGNNATNTWKELFRISLSGTAISFFERLDRLEEYIGSDDGDLSTLALDAFKLIFNLYVSRSVGPPVVAGRIPPPMWEPADNAELRACIDRAVALLVTLSRVAAERLRHTAQEIAMTDTGMLIRLGYLPQMRQIFDSEMLSDEMRAKLVAMIEGVLEIEFARKETGEREIEAYEREVRSWKDTLLPTSVHGWLLSAIGADPWRYSAVRGEQTRDAEIASLAQALIEDQETLYAEMPWLCSPEAKGVVYLGFALGKLDRDAALLERIVEEGRRFEAPGLTRGYIGGLLETWPGHETGINALLDDLEATVPQFAYQVFMMVPEKTSAFARTLRMIDRAVLPPAYLGGFRFTLTIDHFDVSQYTDALVRLVSAIEDGDQDAQRVALDFVGASVHDLGKQNWPVIVSSAPLLDLVWRLMAATASTGTMDQYQWHEVLKALVTVDAQRAAEIAAKVLVGKDYGLEQAGISVLLGMAQAHPTAVMRAVGDVALDLDRGRLFFLHDFKGLFRALPAEVVEEWLAEAGVEAARRLARHLPHPSLDEGGNPYIAPLTEYVLTAFGDDERVREEFALGTHGNQVYMGDMADQMEREAEFAEKFLHHSMPAIREWARRESENQRHAAREWREREQEEERHRN